MSTKGYNTYHGRNSAKKTVAIIALLLVIIGAVGYLVVQNYVVYDDSGQIQLVLPKREKKEKHKSALSDEDVTI